ncbi:MAG: cobalamin B12-binding domain-containing protein [Nitrospirae bacterium]|nr:cobalamin B12-binding domain-containing protein [Nitrospirota bacterium]
MMNKKVLLITPPYHSGVVEAAGAWLNLGFVYIAGSLRSAGYDVQIYDAMSYFHDYAEIGKKIEEYKPDAVALTAITASVNECLKVCNLVKEINRTTVTILGNVHPTFCWEEILGEQNGVDYIVRGEGEITLPELLTCHFLKGDLSKVKGIIFRSGNKAAATPSREFIKDLDALPLAWDLVDWKIYSYRPVVNSVLAIVSSSRGCSQQCSFCSQQLFWDRKWRARSPENFVSGRNLGIDLLMETRVEDILRDRDLLHKYRKAGIVHIYAGVEAVRQESLDKFKKNLRIEDSRSAIELINQHDIVSETSFVLGVRDETPESIERTLELAKLYAPDMAFFLAIAPWPYADLYKELEPYITTKDYSKYNLVEPVVKPVGMTIEQVRHCLLQSTKHFYMDKLKKIDGMSPFKKEFMLSVMKLLIEHSYLSREIKGAIPPEVKGYLKGLNLMSPIP